MAQTSEVAANPQQSLSVLQARDSSRKEKLGLEKEGSTESGGKDRVRGGEQNYESRTRVQGDQVQLGPEGRIPEREVRAEEGSRNEDNLRPVREQRQSERGAAQVLEDLENDNARGVRDRKEAEIRLQESDAPEEEKAVPSPGGRADAPEGREVRNEFKRQDAERKSAEVQLRNFQKKDEIRIEPKVVSETVDDIETRRDKAEAASEPALKPPSQKIIQSGVSESQPRTSGTSNAAKNKDESVRPPPDPTSAQTQRGLNVDDLV